jgi:heme A synthase
MRHPEWVGDWMLVLLVLAVLLGAFFGTTQAAHRVGTTFLAVSCRCGQITIVTRDRLIAVRSRV